METTTDSVTMFDLGNLLVNGITKIKRNKYVSLQMDEDEEPINVFQNMLVWTAEHMPGMQDQIVTMCNNIIQNFENK